MTIKTISYYLVFFVCLIGVQGIVYSMKVSSFSKDEWTQTFRELLADQAIVDKIAEDNETLFKAARSGDITALKSLNLGDVNLEIRDDKGYTPLMLAVKNRHSDAASLLLRRGASVHTAKEKEGLYLRPLSMALSGPIDLVALLIARGSEVTAYADELKTNLLHLAGRCSDCTEKTCHLEAVEYLIEQCKLDPTAKTTLGRTPLAWAAYFGCARLVDFFIKKGCGVNDPDDKGCTPLHWACAEGRSECVSLLLDNGARVDCANDYGVTPLHWAADESRILVIELLLNNGASIDKQDRDGETPLHLAAKKGSASSIKKLIEYGADYTLTTKFGSNVLHWAVVNNSYHGCIALLYAIVMRLKRENPTRLTQEVASLLAQSNDRGRTPKELALHKGYEGLAKELATKAIWDRVYTWVSNKKK